VLRGNVVLKFKSYIIIPLLLILIASAAECAPVNVKQYLALRRQYATSVPYETLKADAPSYIGKVFEIRGAMSGHYKCGDTCGFIINTPDKGSFTISADAPPVDSLGTELACLVKIGERSTCSLSDLRLVACTYEVELSRLEEKAKPKPAVQVTQSPSNLTTTSAKDTQPQYHITAEQLVGVYKRAIKRFNSRLSDKQADTIARSVLGFSYRYKLDPRLVCAVILAESHFRIEATSHCGAQGLGQLMPSTAAGLGVNNAYDPVANVYGSVRYIKGMLDRMSGNKEWSELTWYDLALALAAYNAGPGAVKKHGGVPPYRETQAYVKRVVSIYKQLCGVK